ncbi:MAG: arsenate reductase/protein-tyrosine-phosphatase family protein [Marinibacterium sp.]
MSVPDQLSALAHPRRLDVFRLLMRRYPDAVPAGEIAQALGLKANTASVYLSALRHAGLISQTRQGTYLMYRIQLTSVQAMFSALLSDCCRNRPDICLPWQHPIPDAGADAPPQTPAPTRVLFLCSHNSARSILAQALLRAKGAAYDARSAGTDPADAPDPAAIEVLSENGIDGTGLASTSTARFLDPAEPGFDMVITLCDRAANEDCAHWPGTPLHAHWSIPDPRKPPAGPRRLAAMRQAFESLRHKIDALDTVLQHEPDRAEMQAHLDAIGRMHRAGEPA